MLNDTNTNKNELVVTYGFEYDKFIFFPNKSNICKSIITNNPIYSSVLIRDYNINSIITKIKIIESKREKYLSFIDDLASLKETTPKWQLVIYDKTFNDYVRSFQNSSLSSLK